MANPSEFSANASGAQSPQFVLNQMSAGQPVSAGAYEPGDQAKRLGLAKKAIAALVAIGLSATMMGNLFTQKDTRPLEVTQKTNVTQQMYSSQRAAFPSAHKDQAIQSAMAQMQAKVDKSREAYQAARQNAEFAAQQIAGLKGADYLNPEKLEQAFGPSKDYLNAKWEYLTDASIYEGVLAETVAREMLVTKINKQSDVSPEVMASVALAHDSIRAETKEMLKDGTMGSFEISTLNHLDRQIKEMKMFADKGDVSSMAEVAKDMASEFNSLGKNDPLYQAFTKGDAEIYKNIAAKEQSETQASIQRESMRG